MAGGCLRVAWRCFAGCIHLTLPHPCRLNKLPLTLADLSGSVQIDVHTLGHYYCALCRLLDLQPPLLLPADLLPRSVDRVTAEAVARGALAAGTVAAVQRDAGMLLDWMHRQLNQRQFPLGCVGAALVLAAEMNTVRVAECVWARVLCALVCRAS